MASMQDDQNDDAIPQTATLDSNSTPAARQATRHQHHKELAGHLIDNAVAVGHGHLVGRQGPKGHDMPANDLHKQTGSYIPRGVMKSIPAKQTEHGVVRSSADSDAAGQGDYGVADDGK